MQLNQNKPNYFVCADFETYKTYYLDDNNQQVIDNKISFGAGLIVCLETKEKFTDRWIFTVGDLQLFLNQIHFNLCEINNEKNEDVVILFHNLGTYDGEFIFKYFVNVAKFEVVNDVKYNDGKRWRTINMDNKIFQFSNQAGNYYQLCVGIGGVRFWFVDSYKIVPLSIKDLGDYQKMPKLNSDYNHRQYQAIEEVPLTELEYCKRDIEIMVNPLLETMYKFKPNKHRLTLGSYSINMITDTLDLFAEGHSHFIKGDYADCIDNLKWRRGGFTFVNENKKNQLIEDIKVYDANSFYPSQMIHPLPIGSKVYEQQPEGTLYKDYIELIEILVYEAKPKFKSGVAVLYNAYRKDKNADTKWKKNKYLFEINSEMPPVVMHFYVNEWNELQNWFNFKHTLIRSKYYKMRDYLKELVIKEYNLRLKQKNDGNPAELSTKQNINTFYGKLAENPIKAKQIYIKQDAEINKAFDEWQKDKSKARQINYLSNPDNLKYAKKLVLLSKRSKVFDVDGYKCYLAKDYHEPELSRNPVIGGYITSRARTILLTLLRLYNDFVCYGDTDSIFITKDLENVEITIFDGNKISFGKSKKLMDWKREKEDWGTLYFIAKRVKCYALVGIKPDGAEKLKIASAGFKINTLEKIFTENGKFNFKDFLNLNATTPLPEAKIKKIRTKNGVELSTYLYAYMKGL